MKNIMNKSLIWLDDERNPFEGTWMDCYSPIKNPDHTFWLKSYAEFVRFITINGLPDAICFDHDLGEDVVLDAIDGGMSKKKARRLKQHEKTGMDCAKWLVEYCMDNGLKLPKWNIQSFNPCGKENIRSLLVSFEKHGQGNI